MRTALVVCVALAACGKKTEESSSGSGSSGGSATPAKATSDRFAKVKQPKVSPVCEKARGIFGYGAECIETELPDLTSAAGKITRVMKKGDPTGEWLYVLAKPDGSSFLGRGGTNGDILDETTKGLDMKATPPEVLAKLETALYWEVAIVRCLPGSDDKLVDKAGKAVECKPPAISTQGDKTILTYTIEKFPHVRLMAREDHSVFVYKSEVKEHELSYMEGERVAELPVDAPLPKDAPPPPTTSTPPDWVAKPVPAADDVGKALCALAVETMTEMKGRQCNVFAYPSLDTPAGSVFYLATDSGRRQILGLKKPDGKLVVGYDVEATENPMIAIVKTYDPKTMPAEKIVALHLFLHGEAARILCLPGSGDVIPDSKCEPPKAEKKGEDLVITYIVEELPFADNHGNVSDPSVRSYSTELSPGGGSSGGGFRLIDMRDE